MKTIKHTTILFALAFLTTGCSTVQNVWEQLVIDTLFEEEEPTVKPPVVPPPVLNPPVVEPAPQPEPIPTPPVVQPEAAPVEEAKNPVCSGIRGKDVPGAQFVWKPISEANGLPVVLFPPNFKKKFDSVIMNAKDGSMIHFVFADWGNPDPSMTGNPDERQTWRTATPCFKIAPNAFIRAYDGEQECFWQIGLNPCERFD